MFYVGYFSWWGARPNILTDHQPRGGFTCFVEADSVDEAGEKLRALVEDLKNWAVAFEDVARVYFDDLLEVKELPPQGVLAIFDEDYGEEGTVSNILPGVPSEFCQPYQPRNERDEKREDGTLIEAPFVSFIEEDEDAPPPGPFSPHSPGPRG